MRRRIGDRRVLGLVKAFLKAGVLGEDQVERDTVTGTPQGGILSPLLANIALSVLDEHFMAQWESWAAKTAAARRRAKGLANYRIIRYADDFVVLLTGTKEHTEALREEVAAVLSPMGLRLSEEKTLSPISTRGSTSSASTSSGSASEGRTAHDVHLPVQDRPGGDQGEGACAHAGRHEPDPRQPAAPAEPGAAGLGQLLPPRRVGEDLQLPERLFLAPGGQLASPKAPRATWSWLRRHHLPRWRPTDGEATLFNPATVRITRYRYRGTRIPTPWAGPIERTPHSPAAWARGEPDAGELARPVRECGPGRRTTSKGGYRAPARHSLLGGRPVAGRGSDGPSRPPARSALGLPGG